MNFHPHNDIVNLQVPKGFTARVSLSSFTEANVARGSIMSTITDLGAFTGNVNLHIGRLMESLEQYTMPKNLPQWKVDMLERFDQPGSFHLNVEYVPIEIVGQVFHAEQHGGGLLW